MGLALYPSRVRSNEVLDGAPATVAATSRPPSSSETRLTTPSKLTNLGSTRSPIERCHSQGKQSKTSDEASNANPNQRKNCGKSILGDAATSAHPTTMRAAISA